MWFKVMRFPSNFERNATEQRSLHGIYCFFFSLKKFAFTMKNNLNFSYSAYLLKKTFKVRKYLNFDFFSCFLRFLINFVDYAYVTIVLRNRIVFESRRFLLKFHSIEAHLVFNRSLSCVLGV